MSKLLLLALLGCGAQAEAPPKPAAAAQVTDIDVARLAADLQAGKVPVLVDVRTPSEYAAGHVPGAIDIPISELPDRLAELARYRAGPVYVICQSGARSAHASRILGQHGFHPVNVLGGTAAWKAAGHAVE